MFDLERKKIDTSMKIEHDKICEGYSREMRGWSSQSADEWKSRIYETISALSARRHHLQRMEKMYENSFHSGQLLRLPTEVSIEVMKFVMWKELPWKIETELVERRLTTQALNTLLHINMVVTRYRKNLGNKEMEDIYVRQLAILMKALSLRPRSAAHQRLKVLRVFEYMNFHPLTLFGFSGGYSNLMKGFSERAEKISSDVAAELQRGGIPKRLVTLDKALLVSVSIYQKKVEEQKSAILMALHVHFPQDIVREIAENYV